MSISKTSLQARYKTIATLLHWEGELRNSRLQKLFKLKTVQVSRLISGFDEAHQGLLKRDVKARSWEIDNRSKAGKSHPTVDEYVHTLSELKESTDDWLVDGRTSLHTPDPKTFATIRKSCLARVGIRIYYLSMSTPNGDWRLIFPQAIVRLGQRWHVRAWCADRLQYRDFNIGRISKLELTKGALPSGAGPDVQWEKVVPVELSAHRFLSELHTKLVQDEYFDGKSTKSLEVRGALVQYALNEIRATATPNSHKPPEYLLEVANTVDISPFLFERKEYE